MYNNYQKPEIMKIKNPYDNLSLDNTCLYNIYVQLVHSKCNIPWIVKEYVKTNFSKTRMMQHFGSFLYSYALKEDINKLSRLEYYALCVQIIHRYYSQFLIKIDISDMSYDDLRYYFNKIMFNQLWLHLDLSVSIDDEFEIEYEILRDVNIFLTKYKSIVLK
jgi:hypothetical protein